MVSRLTVKDTRNLLELIAPRSRYAWEHALHLGMQGPDKMKTFSKQRGAVFAEFAIVLMPLLITFFSFVQLAQNATADLYVRHAANVAARAAAVMAANDNPGLHEALAAGTESAARESLGRFGSGPSPMIAVTGGSISVSEGSGPTGTMRVEVRATLNCRVPLGKLIACGGSTTQITHVATFPKQGARYK